MRGFFASRSGKMGLRPPERLATGVDRGPLNRVAAGPVTPPRPAEMARIGGENHSDTSRIPARPGCHWYVPTVQVETAYNTEVSGFGHASPFFVRVGEPGGA